MNVQTENQLGRIFSAQLKGLMDERDITQAALAAGTGVTQTSVSRWLKGSVPGSAELLSIARFFHVAMETLLTGRVLAANTREMAAPHIHRVPEKILHQAAEAAKAVVALQDALKKMS